MSNQPGGETTPTSIPTESKLTPEELAAATAKAEEFLRDYAPHIGGLFGIPLNITVGNEWSTAIEGPSATVTADVRFFTDRGYEADDAVYATFHEVVAHLRERLNEPRLTEEVVRWIKQGAPNGIFHNILSDIAGNRLVHAMLPAMARRAEHLYSTHLFPEADYTLTRVNPRTGKEVRTPRHLQFLYLMIREQMIPGSTTTVAPEVLAAREELRNHPDGDVLERSTAPSKSAKTRTTGRERFEMWKQDIFPIYQRLLEMDREDPNFQNQPEDGEGGQDGEQNGEGQESGGQSYSWQQPSQGNGRGEPSDEDRFGASYTDYYENRHADPLSEEDEETLDTFAQEHNAEQDPKGRAQDQRARDAALNARIQDETGHTLEEKRAYDGIVEQHQDAIGRMREVFQAVIQRGIAARHALRRTPTPEGDLLDTERLAQTIAEVQSGIEEPDAFREYYREDQETEAVGKTDYYFLVDRSGSMDSDGRSQAAAEAVTIALEGLAGMERDIKDAEREHDMHLDLEVRSAIYTFSDDFELVKPLSSTLTLRERLNTYSTVMSPEGRTHDHLALNDIAHQSIDDEERRRIVVVITDGESSNRPEAIRAVRDLKAQGYEVYGIGIGSEAVVNIYPRSQRIRDPRDLPEILAGFIESTIA